jgi:hypothetical protein
VLDEEPPITRDVAVMSRTTGGSWQYDAEVLLATRKPARLNAIGRDGFVPVRATPSTTIVSPSSATGW